MGTGNWTRLFLRGPHNKGRTGRVDHHTANHPLRNLKTLLVSLVLLLFVAVVPKGFFSLVLTHTLLFLSPSFPGFPLSTFLFLNCVTVDNTPLHPPLTLYCSHISLGRYPERPLPISFVLFVTWSVPSQCRLGLLLLVTFNLSKENGTCVPGHFDSHF